jgi:hypothetical protein
LKENKSILCFGFLKPEKIKYIGKNYELFGIRNVISIEQRKGYGTILIKEMIKHLKKKQKTGLGFTGSRVAKFYKKVGFSIRGRLRKKFFPNYGKKDSEIANWGFYIEGEDNLISKLIKSKEKVKMSRSKW